MHSLELTSEQLTNQRAYKFDGSVKIKITKNPREDSRCIDKQPDKSCPEGIPDVSDSRARHVDAMQLNRVVPVFQDTYIL